MCCLPSQDVIAVSFLPGPLPCRPHLPAFPPSLPQDGLESKNNKTKVVCAEEIGCIIDRYGAGVYRKQPDVLPAVAKLVSERDVALRQAVLGTMEHVYSFEGDGGWFGTLLEGPRQWECWVLVATNESFDWVVPAPGCVF